MPGVSTGIATRENGKSHFEDKVAIPIYDFVVMTLNETEITIGPVENTAPRPVRAQGGTAHAERGGYVSALPRISGSPGELQIR